jgi:putative RecB family exonuclease
VLAMATYSHSRISSFEQCPLRFKFHYIDEVETDVETTAEAFLGSKVHETLEKLYKDLKFQKQNTLQELLHFYNDEWAKSWNDNIKIVRAQYGQDNFRKMGEQFITDYYNKYQPFNQAKTIGLEMQIILKLDPEGKYVLQGYIDRLSSPGDGIYEIHDYKTSNSLPTQDHVDTDRQLALYSMAVREMFQDCKKVILIWHYLAFDKEIRSERSEEQLEELKKEVIEAIKQIEGATEFNPKESTLCQWCDYMSICPRFSHLAEVEKKEPEEFLADDGVKMANEYAALKAKEGEVQKRLDELKENIFKFGEQKKIERIYGSDAMVTIWKKDCLKFPTREDPGFVELVALIKKQGLWDEFSALDKYKLEKAFEGGQIDFEKMKEMAKYARKETIKKLYLRER